MIAKIKRRILWWRLRYFGNFWRCPECKDGNKTSFSAASKDALVVAKERHLMNEHDIY